jgi:hypothetical protein
MTIRNLCIKELDSAIAISEQLKISIRKGNYRIAINQIADLLFVIGQSLTCINRVESTQSFRRRVTLPRPAKATSNGTFAQRTSGTSVRKARCLQLVNTAIDNFQTAKRLVRAGRYEDAENIIAATLTGRILRCVNSLR